MFSCCGDWQESLGRAASYDPVIEELVITDDRTQITVKGKVRSQGEERLAELVTRALYDLSQKLLRLREPAQGTAV
jgi:hypothetical protein